MTRLYLSPPHMSGPERALLLDAYDSNWIAPLGPHVDAFERELASATGVPHAAALSSGTAGLHLALVMLGVGPGDEVLVSTLTFAASANVVRYVGATPVFIDADAATWTMDPALLEEELAACAKRGRLPKAVITVDLYGQCCDYERIAAACARYEVPIIEDAAEALGATYRGKPAGGFGAMGVLSFNGNKIITTSGGGALLSHDERWVKKARHLATQAREPAAHYEHTEIGYNYRLSNLLAAVGRGQLQTLSQRVEARRATNAYYRSALGELPGVHFMPEASYGTCTFWLTCLTIDPTQLGTDREALRVALEKHDIEARPVWKPMHLQPVFASCRARGGDVARDLFERGLCLPSGSQMTDGDRERVVMAMRDALPSPPRGGKKRGRLPLSRYAGEGLEGRPRRKTESLDHAPAAVRRTTPRAQPTAMREPTAKRHAAILGRDQQTLSSSNRGSDRQAQQTLSCAAGEGKRATRVNSAGEGRTRARPLPTSVLTNARRLRTNATDAESLLWGILRNRGMGGYKFRRQAPFPPFVADFYCARAKLVVELDGGQHSEPTHADHDAERTRALEAKGLRVLRFWNHEVTANTDEVLEALWNELDSTVRGARP